MWSPDRPELLHIPVIIISYREKWTHLMKNNKVSSNIGTYSRCKCGKRMKQWLCKVSEDEILVIQKQKMILSSFRDTVLKFHIYYIITGAKHHHLVSTRTYSNSTYNHMLWPACVHDVFKTKLSHTWKQSACFKVWIIIVNKGRFQGEQTIESAERMTGADLPSIQDL